MSLLSVIRRWHFRQEMPIREIARRTGLSRNTIRKYLRAGTLEPKFSVSARPSQLDPYAEKLSGWLVQELSKSGKQRRTAKQMHSDLAALGYGGSYTRVTAFVREWKAKRQREEQTSGRGTFVPLAFAPGEAFQFDWGECWAYLGGVRTKLQVANTKLSHSRAFIQRAYPLQTHEMLFDAHNHAFRVLEGIPERGIYDNMKTAVDKVGGGKARTVNARFAAMASHYLFEPEFCNPASGWEKGQVEKNVQDMRRRLWQNMPRFPDIDALNAWLEAQCIALWSEMAHGILPGTIADVHAQERSHLMPMGRPFDGFVELSKRVSPTCLIHFECVSYSVPASFANRRISLHIYPAHLVVIGEGQVLCEHQRVIDKARQTPKRTIYDWRLRAAYHAPGMMPCSVPGGCSAQAGGAAQWCAICHAPRSVQTLARHIAQAPRR
jgi:transposase